ncbi:2-amino-4-hydroxy-6-hydroxymethyldihydropteridine diphosphokinase [bacterium]|nr:2-amino-4-hydroxy-6-hydroxymethyldihydropteridine diphosphokinase [bacterium]MCB2178954.1 2-amino-4-hydroxy-6-hydroxymethyldihydropteridine diphosphokinase [bacterium]
MNKIEERHETYLNLGSNIEPEHYLPEAVRLLQKYGQVDAISSAWQSHAYGSDGPDFLNACVRFWTRLTADELIKLVLRPIEAQLGRVRGPDKYAPRTIDIDLVLFNEEPYDKNFWEVPFVVVPLAELLPNYPHPFGYENLATIAERARRQAWIIQRTDVFAGE